MNEDRDMIARVLAGDRNAFEGIVLKYEAQVFRWVARMIPGSSVHEVAQEVFIRAFRDLRGYRGDAPFSHWLARVARNVSCDHYRRSRRDRLLPLPPEDLELLSGETPPAASRYEERQLLERIFWALGPEDRLLFTLFYVDERSVREISSELGVSEVLIKVRLHRARKRIRRLIKE